jgi:predicted Zn-dependent protease
VTAPNLRRILLHSSLGIALLCGSRSPAQDAPNFQTLQQSAEKAQEAGNNEQAIADYKRALVLQPDWREGLWALGTLDYDADHYADAVASLTRLVKLAPDSSPAYSLLGLSEFETGDYANAQAHLEKAQSLAKSDDPSIAQVRAYHLALLLNRSGDFDAATALLHATFPQQDPPAQAKAAMGIALLRIPLLPREIDPSQDALLQAAGDAAAVVVQGDAQRSADALAKLIAQYPSAPYLHAAYAHALAAAGNQQHAHAAQQEEAKLSHASIADLYRLRTPGAASATQAASANDASWSQAMQDYSAGKYTEAVAALKAWVQQKPDDGTAWAVMGLSEFELKDYDNALIHLQRGQQLGLGASRQAASLAIYHLALLLNRTGRFDAATTLLATIADFPPMANEVQVALGLSLLRMPVLPADVEAAQRKLVETAGAIAALLLASKYDDAFPRFQKLIAQYPATPYLHYAYGTALESLSQYDEAKAQMRQETKLSPRSALPWIRIASISLRQHLAADALSAAKTAVQLAPESADAHYVLGRSWLEQGDEQKAIPELEKAAGMAPNSPETHFALARAYAKADMTEKATQERAAFARLNALAEQQRASHGDQSYQGPRQAENSSILGSGSNDSGSSGNTSPQQQPQ